MSYRRVCLMVAVVIATACAGPFAVRPPVPRASSGNAAAVGLRSDSGDRFAFAGSLLEAQDGKTRRADVTQKIVVFSTPYPYRRVSASLDYRSTERDGFRNGKVRRWTADAWRGSGRVKHGVAPVLLYGVHVAQDGGSFLYRYPAPVVLDRKPERDGDTWSNDAALRYDESDRDGTVAEIAYRPDGAYAESVRYPSACGFGKHCRLDVNVASNGAAAYAGSALEASGIASIAIGAPVRGSIAIAFTATNGLKKRVSFPAWFARGTALYAESDAIHAHAAFPRKCALPERFGESGNVVVRQIARVDPAAGYLETQETQTYASVRFGTVCLTMSDLRLTYYDFSTGRFGGTPLTKTRVVEVLALRSRRSQGSQPSAMEATAAAASILDRFGTRPFTPKS
jgi:hypothetical protein